MEEQRNSGDIVLNSRDFRECRRTWRDTCPIAGVNCGCCPYVPERTRLAQRRGGAEKGKNGASDTNGLGITSVQLTVSVWNEVE